jgi:exosortase/archaeosortase family protein
MERISIQRYWMILVLAVVALWPVWRWYGVRVIHSSDELGGVVAILTVLVFLYTSKPRRENPVGISWPIPLALLVAYIVSYYYLPPLLRAVLAMALIANLISQFWFHKHFHLGLSALLILSLPLMASLQFYLGYPMRVVVGSMAELLLQLNGLSVIREGTVLSWGSRIISIDAPCSGVKLLWVSGYLASALACFLRLSARQTLIFFAMIMVVVLWANVFRSTALFYLEAGILPMQSWMHDGVGLLVFLFSASTIVWCGLLVSGKVVWLRKSLLHSA